MEIIFSPHSSSIGIPGCVWTDVNEVDHKKITDMQVEQMNKMGWRIIELSESSYGTSPVFRRAFLFFQSILFAMKDPTNQSHKKIKRNSTKFNNKYE